MTECRAHTADTPWVMSVDGLSGSGKTVFAAAVAAGCPSESVQVLHLDDLYPDWDGLAAGVERARRIVARWAVGEDVVVSPTRWPGMPRRDDLRVQAARSLLVEGVGATHAVALVPPSRIRERLWLEASASERRTRALLRDGDMYAPHWNAWAAQEQAFFATHPVPDDVSRRTAPGC